MLILSVIMNYPAAIEWRKRRVYQLMTDRFASLKEEPCTDLYQYCGGDYQALLAKLDYIQDLGYNAIWISPTVEQAENSTKSYHGYWFSNFYGTNSWFGTEQELKDFIKECHRRDIWVMADVVYNHVGNCNNDLFNYSCITTFPLAEYYHDYCEINDYGNTTEVMDCRLLGLPDLDQTNSYVNKTLLDWAVWYQKNFDFDGYRVDTVKHIDHPFWKDLRKVTPWYNIGEIFDGSYDFIQTFTNSNELYTAFNYPLFFALNEAIGDGQTMSKLRNAFNDAASHFGEDVADMGVFMENHDNPRFLTAHGPDYRRYENAITLVHTWIGIPYLYYGCEQDMTGGSDPDNRHALWELGYNRSAPRYVYIQKLNALRN